MIVISEFSNRMSKYLFFYLMNACNVHFLRLFNCGFQELHKLYPIKFIWFQCQQNEDIFIIGSVLTKFMRFRDKVVQGLNFRAGWRDSLPKFRSPFETKSEDETPDLKNSGFSGNFCLHKTELPVFEKFVNFRVMLENFLLIKVAN